MPGGYLPIVAFLVCGALFLWPGAYLSVRNHSVPIQQLEGVVEERVNWLLFTRVTTHRLNEFREVSLQRNLRTAQYLERRQVDVGIASVAVGDLRFPRRLEKAPSRRVRVQRGGAPPAGASRGAVHGTAAARGSRRRALRIGAVCAGVIPRSLVVHLRSLQLGSHTRHVR